MRIGLGPVCIHANPTHDTIYAILSFLKKLYIVVRKDASSKIGAQIAIVINWTKGNTICIEKAACVLAIPGVIKWEL